MIRPGFMKDPPDRPAGIDDRGYLGVGYGEFQDAIKARGIDIGLVIDDQALGGQVIILVRSDAREGLEQGDLPRGDLRRDELIQPGLISGAGKEQIAESVNFSVIEIQRDRALPRRAVGRHLRVDIGLKPEA